MTHLQFNLTYYLFLHLCNTLSVVLLQISRSPLWSPLSSPLWSQLWWAAARSTRRPKLAEPTGVSTIHAPSFRASPARVASTHSPPAAAQQALRASRRQTRCWLRDFGAERLWVRGRLSHAWWCGERVTGRLSKTRAHMLTCPPLLFLSPTRTLCQHMPSPPTWCAGGRSGMR